MNSLAWIGIIVWGLVITAFGLVAPEGTDVQPHDVLFLIAGGLITCLIGITGLMGFMGWVPGLRKQQKNIA